MNRPFITKGRNAMWNHGFLRKGAGSAAEGLVIPDSLLIAVVTGTPTLGQAHVLAPSGIAISAALGTPTLGQNANLVPSDLLVEYTNGAPTLAQIHALAPSGLSVATSVGTPTVQQAPDLSPEGLEVTVHLEVPTLGQVHVLSPTGISVSSALGTPTAGEEEGIVLSSYSEDLEANPPTFSFTVSASGNGQTHFYELHSTNAYPGRGSGDIASGNTGAVATGSNSPSVDLRAYYGETGYLHHTVGDPGVSNSLVSGQFTVPSSAPDAPGTGQWSIADAATNGTTVSVTISALPESYGSAITDFDLNVDSAGWESLGESTTGTYSFSSANFTVDVESDVQLRAVNAIGDGAASTSKPVTPTAASITPPTLIDGATSGTNTAVDTFAANAPDASIGDFVIVAVSNDRGDQVHPVTITAPNGETVTRLAIGDTNDTLDNSDSGAGGSAITIFWYIATAASTDGVDTILCDAAVDEQFVVNAFSFSGVHATPLEVISTNFVAPGSASTSHATGTGTATAANSALLVFMTVDVDPINSIASGWTTLRNNDVGAVCGYAARRDTDTSASESVAAATFGTANARGSCNVVIAVKGT